jgi:hypothetical protein
VILIAQEEYFPPNAIRLLFHHRNTAQDRALKVLLHHRADRFGQAGIRRDRKVECADVAALDQISERR